jgi:hypothetical protein
MATLSSVRAAILRYYHKVAPHPAPSANAQARTPAGGTARAGQKRPAAPPTPPGSSLLGDDEEVIIGEEVPPLEKTDRTALADLIKEREEKKRKKQKTESKSRSAGSLGVLDDLEYLIGGNLREEPDRVEELESKFWALMRIMARKGLLSKEEFMSELDDSDDSDDSDKSKNKG